MILVGEIKTNTPRPNCGVYSPAPIRSRCLAQIFLDFFKPSTRSGNRSKVLAHSSAGLRVRVSCAVIVNPQENILGRCVAHLREQKPDKIWSAVNLLKRFLQCRAKRVACHSANRDIRGRSRKTFGARKFDCQHSEALNITRVADATQSNPIIDLKNFSSIPAESQQQDPFGKADPDNWAATCEFGIDVFTPIRDGLDPTVRFFNHAICDRNNSDSFASGTVSTPDSPTIFMIGKILPCLSTPPVAVSASAAVSKIFIASETASSRPRWRSGFLPQLFS